MFENIEIGDRVILYWNKSNGVIPDDKRNDWSRYPDRHASKVYAKRNNPECYHTAAILVAGLFEQLNWPDYNYIGKYGPGTFLPEVTQINCYEIYHDDCIVEHLSSKRSSVKTAISGMSCSDCKNGFPYAEPNFQKNKLICWSCRDSNKWKYKMVGNEVIIL